MNCYFYFDFLIMQVHVRLCHDVETKCYNNNGDKCIQSQKHFKILKKCLGKMEWELPMKWIFFL